MDKEDRAEKKDQPFGFDDWMKTSSQFMDSMSAIWRDWHQSSGASSNHPKSGVQESWEASLKTWQSLYSAMSDSSSAENFSKSTEVLPDIITKMVQTGVSGFLNIQNKWLQKAESIGQSTKAYSFENLEQNAFKAWQELYQKEFKQFFRIPQLGLTREYQERMNWMTDQFNQFQSVVAEFFYLLGQPMEKSFKVFQEQLSTLADQGKLPDKSKDFYRMWIKILEGHYMTLYQSPEYVQSLCDTLGALGDFTAARHKLTEDMLQGMPVPTQKEMDELYKEIYLLKKRVKMLEKQKQP